MARLPFDPTRARGAAGDAAPPDAGDAQRDWWTVTQACDRIAAALADHLPQRVRVVGEISNLSRRNHWYFSLKDENAVLRCVAWASKAKSFDPQVADGVQVLASGQIAYYGPQGQTQLYVDRLERLGEGVLEQRFRQLCEELRAAGYFDPQRKKPLPEFPRKIAVVTSAKGAALQDVLDTLRRRCPCVDVLVVDVRVQGEQAAPEIVRALRWIARRRKSLGIDAVILTRGGGSIEDLWAFNERAVADVLFDYPIPTVAAIGHETDTTIAELVADCRCATPTQAAMHLCPDCGELLVQVDHLQRRLAGVVGHRLRFSGRHLTAVGRDLRNAARDQCHRAGRRLHDAAAGLERVGPQRVAARFDRTLSLMEVRLATGLQTSLTARQGDCRAAARALDQAWTCRIDRERARLNAADAGLRALDPRSILNRGYSITRDARGRIVRSVHDVAPGGRLETHLHDGVLTSEVVGDPAAARPVAGPVVDRSSSSVHDGRNGGTRRRRPRPADGLQMDLFNGR